MSTFTFLASPKSGAMPRLLTISRWMRRFTLSGILLAPVVLTLFWFWTPDAELAAAVRELVRAAPINHVSISAASRALGFAITGGCLALSTYALFQAHFMFTDFSKGAVFATETTVRLRRLALALTAFGFVAPLTKTLLGLALVTTPDGLYRVILISLNDFFLCLIGGLLLAIACAMLEATRVADEHKLFV